MAATPSKHETSTSGGTSAFIGGAALGMAVGLAANLGRKMAVQGITAITGDWLEGLKAEHRMTLKIFDILEKADESQARRRSMLLTQLKHSLAKHAFQEENVVYPAMRQHDQIEGADALSHDHAYVKQYLFKLTETPRNSPTWLDILAEFRSDLERHIQEEENVLFPVLHQALGEVGNRHVTLSMNKEGLKLA